MSARNPFEVYLYSTVGWVDILPFSPFFIDHVVPMPFMEVIDVPARWVALLLVETTPLLSFCVSKIRGVVPYS